LDLPEVDNTGISERIADALVKEGIIEDTLRPQIIKYEQFQITSIVFLMTANSYIRCNSLVFIVGRVELVAQI